MRDGADWQGEGKAAPLARRALHPELPAVQLDELFGQRQAQARPFPLLRVHAADLLELLKDPLLVLWGDADARVPHRDPYPRVIHPRSDPDLTPVRGEFDGVGEQVKHHLLDFPLVGLDAVDALVHV